ncbi:hypothetical protein KUV65_02000 [Maritalea mobilis]|uniref:histidine phosphotransferase family protein n=1 Tax=Maritalea mobilis TaxID=483324 RepID=UPI001C95EFD2|nr:histidine phosphotransferase family protein [Maritalea mobilis]MBY6200119.1 hypothetical protein [Maritalea mobilis]
MMDDHSHTVHPTQTLAELIGSRLCHDLSNPLGAIGNGVELIEMTGAADGPEMELIRDAVADAQARVRFFRLAFGAAGPDQVTSTREAAAALTGYHRAGRINSSWNVAPDLARRDVKLAFLMVLCAESALPMGAELEVSHTASGQWQVRAEAPRVAMDEALWSVLRFGPSAAGRALRPAEAQFLALHVLAETLGVTINYVADDGGLRMSTT